MLVSVHYLVRVRKGFTLIEVMVVVGIVAILAAIAAPNLQNFIQNAKIRSEAEGMQAGLNLARIEALRRNAAVTFWVVNDINPTCALSNSGRSWVVSSDSPAGACTTASSETVSPRLIQAGAGSNDSSNINVSVTSADTPPVAANCITFNGFGRPDATCVSGSSRIGRMTFISANAAASTRSLEIRIDSGGGSRLCDPAKTGPAGC